MHYTEYLFTLLLNNLAQFENDGSALGGGLCNITEQGWPSVHDYL